jgi:hypothetical protein
LKGILKLEEGNRDNLEKAERGENGRRMGRDTKKEKESSYLL